MTWPVLLHLFFNVHGGLRMGMQSGVRLTVLPLPSHTNLSNSLASDCTYNHVSTTWNHASVSPESRIAMVSSSRGVGPHVCTLCWHVCREAPFHGLRKCPWPWWCPLGPAPQVPWSGAVLWPSRALPGLGPLMLPVPVVLSKMTRLDYRTLVVLVKF